jgi:transcriptional regulator with XRE-family HTH domain
VSESELPDKEKDRPRFRKKDTRVQVALAKFHGMGDDDPWTVEEIADYLNVNVSTVSEYINNTEIGEEVESQLAEAQARTRMKLGMKLLDRLDNLERMMSLKEEEKRPAVVSHRYENVRGKVTMNREGMTIDDEKEVGFTVPVPDKFKEVPKVDNDMKTLMNEWRQTVEQVEDLLGLEEPDKIESEVNETRTEIKLWGGMEDANFPEQEQREDAPVVELEENEDEILVESKESDDKDN